jgi:hypothetical protein
MRRRCGASSVFDHLPIVEVVYDVAESTRAKFIARDLKPLLRHCEQSDSHLWIEGALRQAQAFGGSFSTPLGTIY